MDLRDNKTRLVLLVITLGAALVIGVASCSGGGGNDGDGEASQSAGNDDEGRQESEGTPEETSSSGEPDGTPEPEEILAEVTGADSLSLTVTSAEREASGFLTVSGTLTNGSSSNFFDLGWEGEETELAGNGFSMAGATVTDQQEGKRHLILRDTSGRCLCTQFGGNGIEAGETVPWFAQFPAPVAGTDEVDFQIADLPPATIEISEG